MGLVLAWFGFLGLSWYFEIAPAFIAGVLLLPFVLYGAWVTRA